MRGIFILLILILDGCSLPKLNNNESTISPEKINKPVIRENQSDERDIVSKCELQSQSKTDKYFLQNLAKNEKKSEYWFKLATCFTFSGEYKIAKLYYSWSLSLKPKDKVKAHIYNNLGTISMKEGDWDQALFYFQKAKSRFPSSVVIGLNLSRIYLKFTYFSKAMIEAQQVKVLSPNNYHANLILAVISYFQKNYKKSLDYIGEIPKNKRQKEEQFLYALNLEKLGEVRKAYPILTQNKFNSSDNISKEVGVYKKFLSQKYFKILFPNRDEPLNGVKL